MAIVKLTLSSLRLPRRLNRLPEIAIALVVIVLAAIAGIAIGWGYTELVWLILGAVGGVVGFFVIFKRPALGAALVLGLAPLEGAIAFQGHSAVKLATIFCAAILAIQVIIYRKRVVFDRTAVLGVVLVGWGLITILWSPVQTSSLSEWISFALQSFLYFMLINFIRSREDVNLALWGHVLGGLILSISVTDFMVTRDFLRSEDILGLGLNLASRLIGINLLFALLLYQLESHRVARAFVLFLARILLLISILGAGVGVVVALSRGTWLGVAVSLSILSLVFFLTSNPRISIGQLLLWCLAGFALYYVLNTYLLDQHGIWKLTERFQSGVDLSDSGGGRFEIWQVGWRMFQDAPIWGHGFGSFGYEFTQYLERSGLASSFPAGEVKHAHNTYVLLSAELGLIGIVLFVAILISSLSKILRLLSDKQANMSAFAWGLALFAFLMIATNVDIAVLRKYFWYNLGLITLLAQYWGHSSRVKIKIIPKDKE